MPWNPVRRRVTSCVVAVAVLGGAVAALVTPPRIAFAKKPPATATDTYPLATVALHFDTDMDGVPDVPIVAQGTTTVVRRTEGAVPGTIETEIVTMNLRGDAAPFGPLTIRNSPTQQSRGAVTLSSSGGFPADSFFDVMFEVDLVQNGTPVTGVATGPMRWSSAIESFPPRPGTIFTSSGGPVTIVNRDNPSLALGQIVGASWVPSTTRRLPPYEEEKLDLLLCLTDLERQRTEFLMQRTGLIRSDVAGLAPRIDEIDTEMVALNLRSDGISLGVTQVQNTQTTHGGQLGALQSGLGSMQNTQATQGTQLTALQSGLGSVQSAQATQGTQLTGLQSSLGTLGAKIDTLDSKIDQLGAAVGRIETMLNQALNDLAQLKSAHGIQ